jgi:hypothetical protein
VHDFSSTCIFSMRPLNEVKPSVFGFVTIDFSISGVVAP